MRTNAEAVKGILNNSQLQDSEVDTYIVTANLLIENIIKVSISENLLTEIEKWLAAHLISISRERFSVEEKVGDAQIKYAGKYMEGLKATSYGQMVLVLDTSDSFATTQKKQIKFLAIQQVEK